MLRKIQNVIRHIDDHLDEEITVDDLVRVAGLSRSRFCYLFKADTGFSPMQYLKRRRIETARDLLEASSLRITEVRSRVGLRDRSHFARQFKARFGATPSKYRRQKPGRNSVEGADH